MMCNTKPMLKIGLGMLLAIGIVYGALPEFRDWILAASPTLLLLLCPLSMLFCMKMMHGQNGQSCHKPASPENGQTLATSDKVDARRT